MIDALFFNGNFIVPHTTSRGKTGSSKYFTNHEIDAIATTEGVITHIGTYDKLSEYISLETRLYDLEGKTVVSGFFDAHIHIWKVGDLLNTNFDLRDIESIEELQSALKEFSEARPNLQWIKARGFNEAKFAGKQRMPSARDLDQITTDKPIFVQRTCAHIAVVNTRAMETCGINASTKDPYGGMIGRESNGQPTGRLYETAMQLATRHLPPTSEQDYEQMILDACHELLKNGVTCATDPAVHPELLEVYMKLDKEDRLPIRVCAIPILLPDGGQEPYPLPQKYSSDFLKVDTVKFFSDGGLSGKTAAMYANYKGDDQSGILRLDFDTFYHLAKKAQDAGFQIATHAIGDRAIDLVLSVYRKLYDTKFRIGHRIEHFGIASKEQIRSARKMGVHIVSQPVFLRELGENFRHYISDDNMKKCYPYRSILDAGVNLSFTTDAPVVKNISPLSCMVDAVLRKTSSGVVIAPEERTTLSEALYCYTQGSANASDMKDIYGSISVGKKADFVVLSDHIFEKNTEDIENIKIEQVWVDAIKVYHREIDEYFRHAK